MSMNETLRQRADAHLPVSSMTAGVGRMGHRTTENIRKRTNELAKTERRWGLDREGRFQGFKVLQAVQPRR